MSDYDCSKDYVCPDCGERRFIKHSALDVINHTVDFKCHKCEGNMTPVTGPKVGYEPWQPFYCHTQSRQFDTRENYQKYCKKKGLEAPTYSEMRDMKQEARHMKEEHDKGRISKEYMV